MLDDAASRHSRNFSVPTDERYTYLRHTFLCGKSIPRKKGKKKVDSVELLARIKFILRAVSSILVICKIPTCPEIMVYQTSDDDISKPFQDLIMTAEGKQSSEVILPSAPDVESQELSASIAQRQKANE